MQFPGSVFVMSARSVTESVSILEASALPRVASFQHRSLSKQHNTANLYGLKYKIKAGRCATFSITAITHLHNSQLDRFSRFTYIHRSKGSQCFSMGRHSQILPLPLGGRGPSHTWFLGLSQVSPIRADLVGLKKPCSRCPQTISPTVQPFLQCSRT